MGQDGNPLPTGEQSSTPNQEQPAWQGQSYNTSQQPKPHYRHRLALTLVFILLLVIAAAGAYLAGRLSTTEEAASDPVNQTEQLQNAVAADVFYIADTNEQRVDFYGKDGLLKKSVSLETPLQIPTSELGVNDHIQVVARGERIFFMAGEPEDLLGETTSPTYELYEVTDDKPTKLFTAAENESILKWIATDDGSKIVFQTAKLGEVEEKDRETDVRLLDVESKEITQLQPYEPESPFRTTELVFDQARQSVYFFEAASTTAKKISFNLDSLERTIRSYDYPCPEPYLQCSLEYPEFSSPNHELLVWEYNESSEGDFGIVVTKQNDGSIVASYSLDASYEQIGWVRWSADSKILGFDVAFYGNNQASVSRQERAMELTIADETTATLFANDTPAASSNDDLVRARVLMHGYAASGKYVLIHTDAALRVLDRISGEQLSSVESRVADSGLFIKWLR